MGTGAGSETLLAVSRSNCQPLRGSRDLVRQAAVRLFGGAVDRPRAGGVLVLAVALSDFAGSTARTPAAPAIRDS